MAGALSEDVAPSSSLGTCLSAYFLLPPLESLPYKVWKRLYIAFSLPICVDLCMPHFFKKPQM